MPGSVTPQSLRPRLPAWPLITLDPALSPLSLAVSFAVSYILLINFWISSISCLFFLPLTGNFCPWPRAVKPARFFVAGPAKKVQGLSNQYRHFKLFSISTGRNKPPGKISQSPRPRRPPQPPVTHTHSLCPGVSAPSPAPHPPPGPLAVHEYLREKSG